DTPIAHMRVGEEQIYSTVSDKKVTLQEVIAQCSADGIELFCEAQFNAPATDVPDSELITGRTHPDFTFGAHAVEIAVDVETGAVDVQKLVICYDVGKAINVLNVEGQLEGGASYCLGYALMEDLIVEEGRLKTPSFSEYLIPTSLDVPDMDVIMLESGAGIGPYGAKGVGEPACNSIAPAILNAIRDAVGVRLTSLPATAEKIVFALQKQE
ncbi:MAG: xanthine dehydrogenase family protein molybdopterin-binding subunit, partial [Clostridia bacterium]|nr:xanthine dehydrogenase family protein molybdopterin-binding subunit [Clostridia bacterium]